MATISILQIRLSVLYVVLPFTSQRFRVGESLIQGQSQNSNPSLLILTLLRVGFYHWAITKQHQAIYLLSSVSSASTHGVTLSIQG